MRATDLDRFMRHVQIAENDDCWAWTASKTQGGYGRFTVRLDGVKRTVMAHRWAFEHFVGPIPAGLTLDHLCHNRDTHCNAGNHCPHRSCVNPAHLELASLRLNILRGRGQAAQNAAATICKRGHLLAGTNLLVLPDGKRQCRKCRRLRVRTWRRSPKGVKWHKRYQRTPKRQDYLREYREDHRDENREYQREYYEQNKEHILAQQRKRREENPERAAALNSDYRRRYYEKNAEAIRAKRRARRAANLERERARDREYARARRERLKSQASPSPPL